MSHGLATWTPALGGYVLTWSIQSSALLALGLVAGRLLKRTGPAVQSGIYRTTLAAVLVCPLAAALLSAAGYDGLTLRLPAPTSSHTGAAPQAMAFVPPIAIRLSATGDRKAPEGEPSQRPSNAVAEARGGPVLPGASSTPPSGSTMVWTKEAAATIGISVWVLGAAVIGARLLVGHLRMSRLRALAVPAEPGADALCRKLADRIGVAAPVVLRSPFLLLVIGLVVTLLAGLLAVGSGKAETRPQATDRRSASGIDAFESFGLSERSTVESGRGDDLGTDHFATGKGTQAPAASERADVPIRGRIVDLEGRPIAGVTVTTGSFLVPKSGDLAAWLLAVRQGEPPWTAAKHIDWNQKAPATARHETTTDADGRFRLEGLGAERVVSLTLQGGRITATTIDVATRKMSPIPARGFRNQHGPGFQSIYGAEFTYTLILSRPIEGVVKDAQTGEPLVGTDVRSYRFAGSDFAGTMTLRTKTDAEGRFRLAGMPKGKGNKLIIVPNDEQPYLVQEIDVPDPPGAGPASVEAALPRGVWIEGTLTEKATGKPVPGAWLHYLPFLSNTFAQAHSSFHDANGDSSDIQDRFQSKPDGSFRLVGLPGRAIVGAVVHGKAYLQGAGSESIAGLNKSGHFETFRCPVNPGKLWPTVMKEINPPADATSVRIDLQVTNGFSVRLRVVDAEGRPVTGASTRGLGGRSSYEREPLAGADANVTNLHADKERIVVLMLPARKIGKAVKVRKGDDASEPVDARLEPLAAIAGRVVDAGGNPVQGAMIRPDLLPGGDFSLSLAQVATDQHGGFLVPEVPTGCDYALAVESPGGIRERRFAFLKKATVKPGDTTDVGEIRFKND